MSSERMSHLPGGSNSVALSYIMDFVQRSSSLSALINLCTVPASGGQVISVEEWVNSR